MTPWGRDGLAGEYSCSAEMPLWLACRGQPISYRLQIPTPSSQALGFSGWPLKSQDSKVLGGVGKQDFKITIACVTAGVRK